jgi:hypothetical protein
MSSVGTKVGARCCLFSRCVPHGGGHEKALLLAEPEDYHEMSRTLDSGLQP